ncbi:DNA polymerase alpha catalytic subunit, partial [Podochytrium sp. JEL0797]
MDVSDDDDLHPFGDADASAPLVERGSRRAPSAKQTEASRRKERLELLRKSRSGGLKSRLSVLETPAEPLFDEYDEDDYQKLVKKTLEEDDFVVDDDGKGYADYGDDYGASGDEDEEEEAEEEGRKKRATKAKKAARVSTFFSKQAAKNVANANAQLDASAEPKQPRVVAKKPAVVVNEQALIDSIFKDMDEKTDNVEFAFNTTTTTTEDASLEPQSKLFKHDGIVGDFHSSRRDDIFANAFDSMLADDEDQDMASAQPDEFADFDFDPMDSTPAASRNPTTTTDSEMLTQARDSTPHTTTDLSDAMDSDPFPTAPEDSFEPAPPAPTTLSTAAAPLSGVTIRKFVTTKQPHSKSVASKLLPRFEPVQTPSNASASTSAATAAVAAGCKSWTSVMDSMAVGDTNAAASQGGVGVAGSGGVATGGEKDYFEEDGRVFAYWFDAYEKDGIVYLFAKVFNKAEQKFVSCCITVNNISRVLFVLPRLTKRVGGVDTTEAVTPQDLYEEFDNVRSKFQVKEHKSRMVSRKYAFELPGVPVESDYLKVAYSYKYPPIPTDTTGVTFSHIFGTNANALENFLIKRKIMGPCWLEISEPAISRQSISWTKLELTLTSPKLVSIVSDTRLDELANPPRLMTPPPFVALSLSLRTVVNHQKNANEIVVACAMVYNNVSIDGASAPSAPLSYTVIRPLTDVPMPVGLKDLVATAKKSGRSMEVLPNEKGLLNYLMAILHRTDPDIIIGHNFIGVDLDILLHRLKANKVDAWSKVGRLRRTKWPKLQTGAGDASFQERTVASGRILCDTFSSAKEYVTKAKSYTLTNMALTQLKIVRQELDPDQIPKLFWDAQQLMWLMKHCETDCVLSASLMMKLQVLPLTKQLTGLAGNLWSRTIMAGSRADRNEYLLLHEFHNKKYIVPDKTNRQNRQVVDTQRDDDDDGPMPGEAARPAAASARRKPAYAGGLVLEPKKGLYEKFVLMLDFNSLYPSIIQEFNICFTTVERPPDMDDDTVPEPPDASVPQGILPKLLATLVERRRAVKGLMKSPKLSESEYATLNIRQQALKLTANSMYGCLGFTHSRFYAKPLAMLVTQRGREILQSTVDLATTEKLEVIYGDTDSIMIHTNTDTLQEVIRCGNEFKRAVNKRYRLLEIEIDGIFKKMLLLKKKKYAALIVSGEGDKMTLQMEKKGLDVVRRDWCNLSHDSS